MTTQEGAGIELQRAPDESVDAFRPYVIRIDGSKRGRIRRGERKRVQLEPGPHRLRLTVDWASSPELKLDLAPGETATFECRPVASLLTVPYWATIGRKRYIELSPAPGARSGVLGSPSSRPASAVSVLLLAAAAIVVVVVIALVVRGLVG